MSAPAIPAARAADPGAGASRPAARRTPDAAPDTFGAVLASHGRAPVQVRTAAGQPPAKPEVDSPQTGRSPHRSVAARGRSVSAAGDDAAEHDRTDAATPSTAATDAAPAVTTATAATQDVGLPGAPATPEAPATPGGAAELAAVPQATVATEPGAASVPSTPTDGPTRGRVPATSATEAATTATSGTPVPGVAPVGATAALVATADPVAAPGAASAPTAVAAPVVAAGLVVSGARHTAARDGDPVTPASIDASSAPLLPTAPFSVPATVVTAPTTAPTPSAPPVPASPVPAQVLAAVSPLVRGDDGSYAVQLQLHPHDLGAVQVTVDVRHGEISVQLHTPDAAAQDALRDGLADLRRQLEDQGLRTGSMEVGSGGPQQHRENTRRQAVGLVVPGTGAVASRPGPATSGTTTALDLRM